MTYVSVAEAVDLVRSGAVFAFPTDTIYGIGCCATNETALQTLLKVRGREEGKPLIVLVANSEMLKTIVADIGPEAEKLMKKFWPGPLTIVFPALPSLSPIITAGTQTVAVRIPNNPLLLELLRKTSLPIVAPSANRPGASPSLCAQDVHVAFPDIPVLDGGPSEQTHSSTVIALSPFSVIREGAIPVSKLREFIE